MPEVTYIESDGTRSGTFSYHDIEFKILHCRIEGFLHHWTKPMNFIHEQNIVWLEACQ